MEPVLNPQLFDQPEGLAPEHGQVTEPPRRKTSRAAEYIAALYVALLVCTPWLVRDASFFRPPPAGIEMHLSAAPATHVDTQTRSAPATR